MNAKLPTLSAIVLFLLLIIIVPANAEGSNWENHYSKAARAYDHGNLFEARREFMLAWKEAQCKKEDKELARRVEDLAGLYQNNDNNALAQPLLKLARKLKTKVSCT